MASEFPVLRFVGSLAVPRETDNCPGKVLRLHPSTDDVTSVSVAFLNATSAADASWSQWTTCEGGTRSRMRYWPVIHSDYVLYPDVEKQKCPNLDIVYPKDGTIVAFPGEQVSIVIEIARRALEYNLTCQHIVDFDASISESGHILWNVSDHPTETKVACDIVTSDGFHQTTELRFKMIEGCGCTHRGRCVRADTHDDHHLENYFCKCEEGFRGSRCEIDVDECASNPCYPGVTCIDFNSMYWCSDCPQGMVGDGTHCSNETVERTVKPSTVTDPTIRSQTVTEVEMTSSYDSTKTPTSAAQVTTQPKPTSRGCSIGGSAARGILATVVIIATLVNIT